MIRADVLKAIYDELQHQQDKWGADKQQSVPGYLLIMRTELTEAENGWMKSIEGRDSVLAEIVQIVATGIACLNAYGVSGCPRSTNDEFLAEVDEDDRFSVFPISSMATASITDKEATLKAEARRLYNAYTSNHPTIHCNRFPAWEELDVTTRAEWIKKAREGSK